MLLEHVYTESTVISFEWSSSRSGVGIYINKLWKTSPDLEAFVSSICQKVDLHTVIQGVTKRPRHELDHTTSHSGEGTNVQEQHTRSFSYSE